MYAGEELHFGRLGGEGLIIVEYDSETGGSHGALLAADLGPAGLLGVESTRTWNDWQEHVTPIGIQGTELSSSRRFGRHVTPGTVDVGGFVNPQRPGELSIGAYAGAGAFGGGAYLTLSASSCGNGSK